MSSVVELESECISATGGDKPYNILRVRSTFEPQVQLQCMHAGIDALTPTHRTRGRNRQTHRLDWVTRPVFTGYVFVRYNSRERCEILNHFAYIIGELRFGDQPAFVTAEEMQNVRSLIAFDAPIESSEQLIPGQKVRVVHGPLTGQIGEFAKTIKGDRLLVNLQMFGRSVGTPMDWDSVEPIKGK